MSWLGTMELAKSAWREESWRPYWEVVEVVISPLASELLPDHPAVAIGGPTHVEILRCGILKQATCSSIHVWAWLAIQLAM
jgi:hypothetical protein